MRYLSLAEVIYLHERVIEQSGGASGIRDLAGLESAIARPKASVGGTDAYPTVVEKAAALGFFLCSNHPFVDGNKRIAHAAMEVCLVLNGWEIEAAVPDQELMMLSLTAGAVTSEDFAAWVQEHVKPTG